MLYKKYHRNYVKQFKIGMKIEYKCDFRISTITKEPFICEGDTVCVESAELFCSYYNCIVLFNGKLNIGVYALQKIS